MHKIKLVVVGNLKEYYWKDACNEYLKRLKRFAQVEIVEVTEFSSTSKVSIEQIKEFECAEIKKKVSGIVVALDKGGQQMTSEEFAKFIDSQYANGVASITFVIGGSNGLIEEFLNSCNKTLSFGKLTYPHQLMRVVLLEQIYRAETILNNILYHK